MLSGSKRLLKGLQAAAEATTPAAATTASWAAECLMPQKALGKSKRSGLVQKGGKRHTPADRITKKGSKKKTPKKANALTDYKQSTEVTKAINKRNEARAATLAQRSSKTHLLKNKDLKAKEEDEEK